MLSDVLVFVRVIVILGFVCCFYYYLRYILFVFKEEDYYLTAFPVCPHFFTVLL